MDKKEQLMYVINMRIKAKIALEYFRGIAVLSGIYYEKEINDLLDTINNLNKIEEELMKKNK